MNEYTTFAIQHWELVLAFILVLAYWVVAESQEIFSRHGISTSHLVSLMNHHNAIVVDIRESDVYKKGHILSALSFPEKELIADLGKLKKHREKKVILVDASGATSNRLINKIIAEGFKEIFFLKGGMQSWSQDKLPLEKK